MQCCTVVENTSQVGIETFSALHKQVYPIVRLLKSCTSATSAGSFPSTGSLVAERVFRTFRRNTRFLAAGPASLPHVVIWQVVQSGDWWKSVPVSHCLSLTYDSHLRRK